MRTACCILLLAAAVVPGWTQTTGQVHVSDQRSVPSQVAEPQSDLTRYSPFAAAGGYRRQRETFWEFWLRQFNPRNIHYGTWLEQRRQVFLAAAAANPYFWFRFWELAAICLLLVWLAKERIDRNDTEWEAARAMADLGNYATYCKRHAIEAIATHNEHIEVCNRLIEAAETGRPVAAGREESWRTEMETLRTELAQKSADNLKLAAQLEEKNKVVTGLAARVDELARSQSGTSNGGSNPNVDLVARVNRLTTELQTLREENSRLKRGN